MRPPATAALALACLLALVPGSLRALEVRDDAGRLVTLERPARRIVSLSPHLTELLYAAGAGAAVVGAVEFSDYPAQARRLPRVGGAGGLDLERVLALRPDLVVAWGSGNPASQVARLETLGVPVYVSEPRRIADVPVTLLRLGALAGTREGAARAAAGMRGRLRGLRERYAGRPRVRVFYQVWDRPLVTVNGAHLIGQVLELCGGQNIFAGLAVLAPQVSREAVLAANPEVIIASGTHAAAPPWLDDWRAWPDLAAVRYGNLFSVPPDLIQRHTPRLLQGARRVCRQLEMARARLGHSRR